MILKYKYLVELLNIYSRILISYDLITWTRVDSTQYSIHMDMDACY